MGRSKAPSATMVTPDAPVNAVNRAQATNPTIARPAGIQPNMARVNAMRRSDVFASAIRYPANVKSGNATNNGVSVIRYISIATTDKFTSVARNPNIAAAKTTAKRGAPRSATMITVTIPTQITWLPASRSASNTAAPSQTPPPE